MSVLSLGRSVAARRATPTSTVPDIPPRTQRDVVVVDAPIDRGVIEGGCAGDSAPPPSDPSGPSGRDNAASSALERIVNYIPVEIVLAYVATTAAVNDPSIASQAARWWVLGIFWVLTPISIMCVAAAAGGKDPASRRRLLLPTGPVLGELAIATVAFGIWGFTLPASPYGAYGWYHPAYATVVLLIGSLVLGLVAPFFVPDPPADPS